MARRRSNLDLLEAILIRSLSLSLWQQKSTHTNIIPTVSTLSPAVMLCVCQRISITSLCRLLNSVKIRAETYIEFRIYSNPMEIRVEPFYSFRIRVLLNLPLAPHRLCAVDRHQHAYVTPFATLLQVSYM